MYVRVRTVNTLHPSPSGITGVMLCYANLLQDVNFNQFPNVTYVDKYYSLLISHKYEPNILVDSYGNSRGDIF